MIGWIWLQIKKWAWLDQEPDVKNAKWEQANAWSDQYVDEYLPPRCEPDAEVSALVYEYALREFEDCTEAYNSLTTKCTDLMKLLVTIVAAFLALWRYAASVDSKDVEQFRAYVLNTSNALAGAAILCLVIAIIILYTCLRGMPYLPKLSVDKLLDWAGKDKENACYIKCRVAVRMHRQIVGNRTANTWIHNRADLAWRWAIAGLCTIAFSVILRLFA